MLRVGILTEKGNIYSHNAETRDEIDNFLFDMDDKEGLARYKIVEKETEKIIESWSKG